MKTLNLLSIFVILTLSNPASADMNHATMDHSSHGEMTHDNDQSDGDALTPKPGDARISVNGLVCDFCARALEKTFGKRDEVKSIDVNLETKMITVYFNDGQTLDNQTLDQIIMDSGYNVEGMQRVE